MERKLVDICRIQYGYAFDSANFSDNHGVPLIRIRDVVRGYSETYTTEEAGDEYIVNNGDILIGMDGEFNIAHWKGGKAYLNQRVCKLMPTDDVDALYLFYFMPKALKAIEEKTPFVTVKHLSAKELNKVVIPLPSLEEQKNIAGSLQKVDELIALRKEQLAKLDQLVKSRFIELFGDPIDNPLNWKVANFQDVVYFQEGPGVRNWQFRDSGIKLINIRNLVDDNLVLENTNNYLSEQEVAEKYKHFLLEVGDYVMASSGVTWGKIAEVFDEHLPLCLNTSIIRLRPYDEQTISKKYLFHYIKGDAFRMQISRLITGSAQPNFGPTHLKKISILVPPIKLQEAFAEFAEQTDKSKLAIQQSLDKLETLKKSLMQEYFG